MIAAGPEDDGKDEGIEESRQASNHEDHPQLSADTLRGYKEGIVDLLQPCESVFGALRRLGGLQVWGSQGSVPCGRGEVSHSGSLMWMAITLICMSTFRGEGS